MTVYGEWYGTGVSGSHKLRKMEHLFSKATAVRPLNLVI